MARSEGITKAIDQLATRIGRLKCGHSDCTYGEYSRAPVHRSEPDVRWCGSCATYWYLCEALRESLRDDFSAGDSPEMMSPEDSFRESKERKLRARYGLTSNAGPRLDGQTFEDFRRLHEDS